jgi:hypothetical protein
MNSGHEDTTVKGARAWISVPGAMAASQAFTRDFSFSMELVTSRLHHFSLTHIVPYNN